MQFVSSRLIAARSDRRRCVNLQGCTAVRQKGWSPTSTPPKSTLPPKQISPVQRNLLTLCKLQKPEKLAEELCGGRGFQSYAHNPERTVLATSTGPCQITPKTDSRCPKVEEPTCVHTEGLQASQIPPEVETSSVLSGMKSVSKAHQEGRSPSSRPFSHHILEADAPWSPYNLTMKPYKGVLPY